MPSSRRRGGIRVTPTDSTPPNCGVLRADRDPFRFALAGGEDYVLAVTVRPDRIGEVGRDFAARFGRPLHRIGEATDSGHLELVTPDGQTEIVRPTGWDLFGEHGV
jgi:thiamine monophosphate kinase